MANEYATDNNAHPDLSKLAGGLAIVTGGASGIGYAILEAAVAHGLHAVIADIDSDAIEEARDKLKRGADSNELQVIGIEVDVSSEESVLSLQKTIAEQMPNVPISLLVCNAGVGAGGGVVGARDIDWDFVIGVNLKGVAHFARHFVPRMLEQDAPGSFVATSSQDGLCAAQGVYGVTKHACVALCEALYQELQGRLSVHVLCPNVVGTNIVRSGTHRPERFGGPTPTSPATEALVTRFKNYGMPPSRCADMVFKAIQSGDFYILAEAEEDPGHIYNQAKVRMDAILNHGRPFRPPSKFISRVFRPGS
ncbi:MAG: SDR family NAD(P)-dependent oxidoreductase [Gammaproteobacteria bacterium]|nr:SDR family NAD(P)-dependent oxidoreductase [Gammaproteobacteria bacterium]